MIKTEDFRESAARCLRLAGRTSDLQDRTLLILLAERWFEMSKRVASDDPAGHSIAPAAKETPQWRSRFDSNHRAKPAFYLF